MTAYSNPIVVSKSNVATTLTRIPLSLNPEKFPEKFLQDALFANPECLPVQEIDPHIGKLIPICTELETGAGPADILYVTPTGQIVLVETKLWRNPEARRAVIGQILDYAKQLTAWTYDDVARESAAATKKGAGYLLSCLKAHNIEEAAFVDGINRSLSTGDFLLLIVGDGIRSGAESLVGFIERYGNLRFGLGLIEVAAFRLPNDELLLQPRILAKTEILKRTVLVGTAGNVELEQVAIADDTETPKNSDAPWFQSFWTDFLKVLLLDDPLQMPPAKPSRSTNVYLPMPPGGGSSWIGVYVAQSVGRSGVYLTFLKSFDKIDDYYEKLLAQREEIERGFGAGLTWDRVGDKIYISGPNIPIKDLNEPGERNRVITNLADQTNKMVNVMRHRLEAISRELA